MSNKPTYEELEQRIKELEKKTERLLEKLDFMEALTEMAQTIVLVLDTKGQIVRFDHNMEKLSGYRLEEIKGQDWFTTFLPECDHDKIRSIFQRAVSNIPIKGNITPIITKDGREIFVEWSNKTLKDKDGNDIGLLAVGQDVTKHKRTEEDLRKTDEMLTSMLQSINDHMSMMDKDLNIVWANETAKKVFGDNIIGKKCYETFHKRKDPCEPYPCLTLKSFQDGQVHEHETHVIGKDGDIVHFHCTSSVALKDNEEKPIAVLEISRDISKNKQIEDALRKSKTQAENYLNIAGVMLVTIDAKENITMMNKKGYEILGYEPGKLTGKNWFDLLVPERMRDDIRKTYRKFMSEGIGREEFYENPLLTKSGEEKIMAFHISALRGSNNNIIGILFSAEDVSKQKKAEEELLFKNTLLEAQSETSIDGILAVDDAGKSILFNKRFGEIWNIPEEILDSKDDNKMLRHVLDQLKYPEQFLSKVRSLYNLKSEKSIDEIELKNGKFLDRYFSPLLDTNGRYHGSIWYFRDITGRKKTEKSLRFKEKQLQRSQKMETVGVLAGGIAHEFNNLLFVISGNAELLIKNSRSKDTEMLKAIIKSTQRGANLVKQLMAFSRKSESNLSTTLLNTEIQKIKRMLDQVLPRMIDIQLDLADNLYSIKADPGQIEQIVMNLCLNSRDAMPDGGPLTIKTENSIIDETFIDMHPEKPKDLKEGRCVILTVSDTGCGMDQETRERIFEPFFTTKEIGKGTGLGLSVTYGIVEGHTGHISCCSEVGTGTTFRIYFPVIEDDQAVSTSNKNTAKPLSKGTETILIVDDEEAVIKLTQSKLEGLGYKIITAITGESAIDIYTNKQKEIDLILLDLGMPGMGGKKCLEKLTDFDPDVKVIIASGYSDTGLIQDSINAGAKGHVVKPYTTDNISKTIQEVLNKTA